MELRIRSQLKNKKGSSTKFFARTVTSSISVRHFVRSRHVWLSINNTRRTNALTYRLWQSMRPSTSMTSTLRFQACADEEIKTVPRHFCACYSSRSLHEFAALRAEIDALIARYAWVWPQRWVLFFVWALRDTSGRYMVDCTRAIFSQSVRPAAAYFAISLLRHSGEKKQTFPVVSLQLTVQLPCLNVLSSFILPLRACQKRSFDVSTVGAGAERGFNTRQADQSPQSLRSTKIGAWLP